MVLADDGEGYRPLAPVDAPPAEAPGGVDAPAVQAPRAIQAPPPPAAYEVERVVRAPAVAAAPGAALGQPRRTMPPGSCCLPPARSRSSGLHGYAGGFVAVLPGIGAGLEFGVQVGASRCANTYLDFSLQYQDLYEEFIEEDQTGKFTNARVGLKWEFNPCGCHHPTLRVGGTWFFASGNPDVIDVSDIAVRNGDWFGVYLGLGWEWEINRRLSTGPEASVIFAWDSATGTTGIVPTFMWHFNVRF
jgi:hypothetical protein